MNRRSLPLAALALALLGGVATGCVDRQAQTIAKATGAFVSDPVKTVVVESPKPERLEETVEISGDVTTGQDVSVGFKSAGAIVGINVRDGETVRQGQILASLDSGTVLPQLRAAEAALATARAQLNEQVQNARLTPLKSQAAIRQAEAGLRSARANLAKAVRGARPEERGQAEANVSLARSDVNTTRKDLERIRRLVAEGALAQSRLDQQQNLFDTAQARLRTATEGRALITNGTRAEDIAVAREGVREAEGGLANARADQSLDTTLRDQVEAARGQVASAQAQVQVARQALTDIQLRAPFSGRVFGEPLKVGTVVSPGTSVVRLIGGGGVYFEGQIPSAQLAVVEPGDSVRIQIDAIPGRTFNGRIATIAPQGQSVGRLFNARILFPTGSTGVRPGMFARGTVVVREIPDALTLPTSALISAEGARYVVINDGGKAKRVKITTGIVRGDRTQVSGVSADAKVIIQGASELVDGDKLKVETPPPVAGGRPPGPSPAGAAPPAPTADPNASPSSTTSNSAEGNRP